MIKRLHTIVLLLVILLPARGQSIEDHDEIFIHGNIEFVILHELAHVLINDLQIPVIGPEEHAADYLATLALLRPDEFTQLRAEEMRQYATAVASGFAAEWDMKTGPGVNKLPYWDSHGLTIQRFYNIGCLIYGSNPETFPRLPGFIGLPERRAANCAAEYAKANHAVDWLISNYGKKDGEKAAEIQIEYGRTETIISGQIQDSIRDARLIENIVARFNRYFALDQPMSITTRGCRTRQAFWNANSRELVICHELFDYFYSLARNPSTAELREYFNSNLIVN